MERTLAQNHCQENAPPDIFPDRLGRRGAGQPMRAGVKAGGSLAGKDSREASSTVSRPSSRARMRRAPSGRGQVRPPERTVSPRTETWGVSSAVLIPRDELTGQ